ncbi:MAG: hypothetical protein LRZ99_05925 [Desulfotomaculum sp.]|nr:hypothetical protein [Desulfotomaculum sp.]MCL0081511.1 hypothetical protein [Peptococcaceae bacterium]
MREAEQALDVEILDSNTLSSPKIARQLNDWLVDQDSSKSLFKKTILVDIIWHLDQGKLAVMPNLKTINLSKTAVS